MRKCRIWMRGNAGCAERPQEPLDRFELLPTDDLLAHPHKILVARQAGLEVCISSQDQKLSDRSTCSPHCAVNPLSSCHETSERSPLCDL